MTETMTSQDPQGSTNPRKKWVLIGAGVLVALGAHMVLQHRQHNHNLSRDRSAGARRSFALALQKSTERRRQPDGTIAPLPELFYMDPVLKAAGQYLTVGRV